MSFKNCAEAYAAGRADIPANDPAYAPKLDRDGDGVACERKDAPDGFTPKPEPSKTKTAKPVPTKSKATHATVGVQSGGGPQLPKTGPAAEVGGIGAAVLLMGAVVAVAFRRRRTRFTA